MVFDWGRSLLGAAKWKRGSVVAWELGWSCFGFRRELLDVGRRRCKLGLLPETDFYRRVFVDAHEGGVGTWANRSLALLSEWGIPDFSPDVWTYKSYVRHVKGLLEDSTENKMNSSRAKQQSPCPHLRLGCGFSLLHDAARRSHLSRQCPIQLRSWCRMRVGALLLSHVAGRRSQARNQHCIFCSGLTSEPSTHMLLLCPVLADMRSAVLEAGCLMEVGSTAGTLLALLCLGPGEPGFVDAVNFCAEIDFMATRFWRNSV